MAGGRHGPASSKNKSINNAAWLGVELLPSHAGVWYPIRVPSTQYSVPSTRYAVLGTQYSVPSTGVGVFSTPSVQSQHFRNRYTPPLRSPPASPAARTRGYPATAE